MWMEINSVTFTVVYGETTGYYLHFWTRNGVNIIYTTKSPHVVLFRSIMGTRAVVLGWIFVQWMLFCWRSCNQMTTAYPTLALDDVLK
jgi:hypothetical protein